MFEHHPRRSCQLPGDRPNRNNAVGPGLFAFIEALCQGLKAYCKMRRFRKGPGQILIAGLGIARALLFPIAHALSVDTATIRGKIPGTWKTMDVAHLQHDGQTEYRPYAFDRLQDLKAV